MEAGVPLARQVATLPIERRALVLGGKVLPQSLYGASVVAAAAGQLAQLRTAIARALDGGAAPN
eukprot:6167727-Alexandrium_andersonii.AAC.1